MTEREKMLAGDLYVANDPDLAAARDRARTLVRTYNAAPDAATLRDLLGHVGERVEVVPPLQVDYGTYVSLGDGVFINFNCVILDTCAVTIGAGTLVGPGVQFYAATHPLDPAARRGGLESGAPITVGENVWIGGGALIMAGVTIGDDSVIGAGSVVTRSVPAGVLAAGNPCRVIRTL
ncbi:MAG TPA: sugar O-acetyltransferase [Rubricoccaceae bacterium]|jgi:maltose O-acetyltransferase